MSEGRAHSVSGSRHPQWYSRSSRYEVFRRRCCHLRRGNGQITGTSQSPVMTTTSGGRTGSREKHLTSCTTIAPPRQWI